MSILYHFFTCNTIQVFIGFFIRLVYHSFVRWQSISCIFRNRNITVLKIQLDTQVHKLKYVIYLCKKRIKQYFFRYFNQLQQAEKYSSNKCNTSLAALNMNISVLSFDAPGIPFMYQARCFLISLTAIISPFRVIIISQCSLIIFSFSVFVGYGSSSLLYI